MPAGKAISYRSACSLLIRAYTDTGSTGRGEPSKPSGYAAIPFSARGDSSVHPSPSSYSNALSSSTKARPPSNTVIRPASARVTHTISAASRTMKRSKSALPTVTSWMSPSKWNVSSSMPSGLRNTNVRNGRPGTRSTVTGCRLARTSRTPSRSMLNGNMQFSPSARPMPVNRMRSPVPVVTSICSP